MADLEEKVYGITITRLLFEGYKIKSQLMMMHSYKTDIGIINVPYSHKIFKTKVERDLLIFKPSNNKILSISEAAKRYNISEETTTKIFNDVLVAYPEKFI